MNCRRAVIGCAFITVAVCRVGAQTPFLGGVVAPYPAVQTSGSVHVAGGVYGSGAVAYGPVGTPLVLTGTDLGESGIVEFVSYYFSTQYNREMAGTPVVATPTLWTSNMVLVTVPAGASTGLVMVQVEGRTSNGLPFLVTNGTYAGTCPASPPNSELQITTSSLHDGTAGQAYSATLAITGGTPPYTWSLPNNPFSWLSLSSSTTTITNDPIAGTPSTAAGPANLTVQVTDSSTPKQTNQALLSLTIESQTMTPATVYSYNVPWSPTTACNSSNSGFDCAGNITQYQDSVMGTWSFTYDSLNRLATGHASSGDFSTQTPYSCWNYDSFGNRLQQEMSSAVFQTGSGGSSACQPQSSASVVTDLSSFLNSNGVDPGTNQVQSTNARGVTAIPSYDAAGDVTADGANTYLYDAEGRVCAVKGAPVLGITAMTGYLYNAVGQRVAKGTISYWGTCDPGPVNQGGNGFQLTQSYVLGQGGEELTMLDGNNTWQRTNVYASGKLIATYDMVPNPTGTTPAQIAALHFQLTDPLGTRRLQTNSIGQPETDCQSLPFGDQLYCFADQYAPGSADDATPLHFTGKERDSESGNDYFGARYYTSSMAPMMSADWENGPDTVPYADFTNPQSLNLYSYSYNNPLRMIDPDGHVPCNGVANITITVTPTGSTMSQSADDCPTATSLINFPFDELQRQLNPPPKTPPPPPQKKTPGECADAPLAGAPTVTTQFGAIDASHPTKPHTGRDYAAPIGTPVYASISGGVTYAGDAGTFGNVVVISAPLVTDSASVIYEGHLSSVSVSAGQHVNAGDQIGLSGNTGHSTGPHVHHEQHTPGPAFQNGHPPSSTLIDPCN